MAFEQFYYSHWDRILGIENHSREVERMRSLEERRGWEPVRVNAPDGTILRGTYIKDKHDSHYTVILLHGLYQNRSMCLPYVEMYRNVGYNVLLIDQRGHGGSEGEQTTWGLKEMDDMTMWCQWLHQKDPHMEIGLHGISLGAAMALLYAGSEWGKDIAFVVADSSYGNIVDLGRQKLWQASQDERAIWGYDMLDPFFQATMFFHTHKLLSSIEPANAVQYMSAPVLFIHGGEDTLVPVQTARDLFAKCASPDKHIYIFSQSPHAAGIETDHNEYMKVVEHFLANTEK